MRHIVSAPAAVNPDDDLDTHAAEIRKGLQEIRITMSNALDIGLAVGQRLNIAKDQVDDGKWSKWLRDDCELSRSTALLYMRLANHQGDIDAARVQLPDLSLRAARRLLTKSITPEAEESDPAEPDQEEPDEAGSEGAPVDYVAEVQELIHAQPIEVQEKVFTAILATIKVSDLLRLLPPEKIDELATRVGQDRKLRERKRSRVIEGTATHIN